MFRVTGLKILPRVGTHFFFLIEKNNTLPFKMHKGDLAIRRIFSLVDMITKPKFSNCPNVLKLGLFL